MDEDPLSKLSIEEISDASDFTVIAPIVDQTWNEALDDDNLWMLRVQVQSVLTRPWYVPLALWMPVVSVRQWRLRRMLKRMSR